MSSPAFEALFSAVQRSNRTAIDDLVNAGANINGRTAAGFGVLDECHPDLVGYLIARGAKLDAHSASRLGMLDELRSMVLTNPGGDGMMPLHCASTIEVAVFLLDNGADIDARDSRLHFTPAQHMLRDEHKRHYPQSRQNVARYLVSRGCFVDIHMAAALGDFDLAKRLLDDDPECIRMTVNGRTAHTVARDFGHEDVFGLLAQRTPADLRLALACELADEAAVQRLTVDPHRLTEAARNNNAPAVRVMLNAGWPVDSQGEMGASALHWAAFNGNAEMTRAILEHHPSLELKSDEHESTPIGWAIFGSGNSWHSDTGDYVGTVKALLAAGAVVPPHAKELEPSEAVLKALEA